MQILMASSLVMFVGAVLGVVIAPVVVALADEAGVQLSEKQELLVHALVVIVVAAVVCVG
jgi:hypothetical protein